MREKRGIIAKLLYYPAEIIERKLDGNGAITDDHMLFFIVATSMPLLKVDNGSTQRQSQPSQKPTSKPETFKEECFFYVTQVYKCLFKNVCLLSNHCGTLSSIKISRVDLCIVLLNALWVCSGQCQSFSVSNLYIGPITPDLGAESYSCLV